MALSDLIGDLDTSEFLAKHWDRNPVLLKRVSKVWSTLARISDVESCLTETDIRFPQFQLAMQGQKLSKADYTRRRSWGNHTFEDLIDIPAMYRLWNAGATIILQSLQTNFPKLIPILRELEAELHHPVQANLYLSPRNSQGFTAHYDTHDVFVVQIEGSKNWRVWQSPSVQAPLKDEHSPRDMEPMGPLLLEHALEPGDVLYLPRGFYHEASSGSTSSMHLTIGVLNYRRIDAVRFIFDDVLQSLRSSTSTEWRASLPPRFDKEVDEGFQSLKNCVIEMVDERWSTLATSTRFREDLCASNQGLLSSHNELASIHDATRLIVIPEVNPEVRALGDKLVISFGGRTLSLPASVESALTIALHLREFSPSELAYLSAESRVGLCAHLVREGLLRLKQ